MRRRTRNPLLRQAVQREVPATESSETRRDAAIWERSRLATLLLVLGLHAGVIAWLVALREPGPSAEYADPPLEIVYLPPVKYPQALADTAHLKHLYVNVDLSISPPLLDSDAIPAPVSQTGGHGAGVNWAAEAHRAVKAFEIRRDEHVIHSALGTSVWDGWAPPGEHHPGDRYRTESGDWLVWIDNNCYQIATWHDGELPREEAPPLTYCVDASGAVRAPGGPK